MSKVYCDRLATVTIKAGTFPCPKCGGVCKTRDVQDWDSHGFTTSYDCHRCGRGWDQVPDTVKTENEALTWLTDHHHQLTKLPDWTIRDSDASRAQAEQSNAEQDYLTAEDAAPSTAPDYAYGDHITSETRLSGKR